MICPTTKRLQLLGVYYAACVEKILQADIARFARSVHADQGYLRRLGVDSTPVQQIIVSSKIYVQQVQ